MRNNQIFKILIGSWVIPKMYEKRQKKGFRRNNIIPKPMKVFNSKFDTPILKTNVHIVSKFQICVFRTYWEIPCQMCYGLAGPVHHGCLLYIQKEMFFVLWTISKKSIVSDISHCLKLPYDCGKKLSCELASRNCRNVSENANTEQNHIILL